MTDKTSSPLDPDQIVDQLYDIALDPETLNAFIGAWNDAGLDAQTARQTMSSIDAFDSAYQAHLKRAETFLARNADADITPDLAAMLGPFDNLAAFIVSADLMIAAANDGARHAFGIRDGVTLQALHLPDDLHETLTSGLDKVISSTDGTDLLLRLDIPGQRGPALFQIRRLAADGKTAAHALVVTTQYHWRAVLGQTLEEVFGLTDAEQGVVRALVEGQDAKTIATARGTSEGTVRSQIKSILSKMNARSQSEVIRLVLSLRDVARPVDGQAVDLPTPPELGGDWLQQEVWKPFKTLVLPDGRKFDYHDMGPALGAPVLFSHMGYGLVRWHAPMLKLAFQHGLRIIVPIRAGYGQSENLAPKSDVMQAARDDVLFLLDHLGIDRLPYVAQGNDLIFAVDLYSHAPERVSEIVGICARPSLPGDQHYAGMAKWHRFFLSTAKHAPHLLNFTAKAAIAMAKRIGPQEMFRQMNQQSPADMALLEDPELLTVLLANADLLAGPNANIAQAYAMELLCTEADWSHLMFGARDVKMWFVNGGEDPAADTATIAAYRETYPWIDIAVIPQAGQMLIYQQFDRVIPLLAQAAKSAQSAATAS